MWSGGAAVVIKSRNDCSDTKIFLPPTIDGAINSAFCGYRPVDNLEPIDPILRGDRGGEWKQPSWMNRIPQPVRQSSADDDDDTVKWIE